MKGIKEVRFINVEGWICVFKLTQVNFPILVASSCAKDPVLILAIKTTLLISLHQHKESYRVSIC